MELLSVTEAERKFEELIEGAENGKRATITDSGDPLAVIMSYDEYLRLIRPDHTTQSK